jgi:hypothetical protein
MAERLERLNNTLQENIITLLAHRDIEGKLVANIVKSELFEGDYRTIAERCLTYWETYNEAPKQHTPDLVADITDDPNNRRASTYRRILSSMIALSESVNTAYVLDQLTTFTRLQKFKSAIIKSAEQLNTQQEIAIGGVERIWNDLLKLRETNFDAGLRLTEVGRLIDYQNEQHDEFKTGIEELDRRHVAPYRDAVTLIIGATGRGKTWGLIHLAKQALLLRKKVVHITLEMPAEQVGLRYYQSFFGIPKRQSRENGQLVSDIKIPDLTLDDKKKLTKIGDELIKPEFTLADPMIHDELSGRLEWLGSRVNNLVIKRFARMTIRDLEAYLDNLEVVEGFIPDMVILDYFGLVDPETKNDGDHRIGLGRAFINFRSLMLERHVAGITAQQASKLGSEARSVKLSHVAEDWSLTNTADLIYTFSATDMEKRYGLGRLYVGKARDESDQFGVLLSQSYETGQFVLQSTYLDSHYFDMLDKLAARDGGNDGETSEEGPQT